MNEFVQDRSIKKSLVAVLVLLAVFLLITSINAIGGNSGDSSTENTIVVSGEGEVSAVPDIATFTFSVTEERETVAEAQSALSEDVSKTLAALRALEIEEKDVKTLSYNIYPRYEFFRKQQICPEGFSCPPSSNERVLVGYEASQSVSIRLNDLEKAGEVLEGLGNAGVDNINGPSFEIENKDELERKARKMAIDEARKKARDLAKDLGVKLGKVVSFSEGGRGVFKSSFEFAEDSAVGIGGSFAPEIPVGESEITSSVTIVYEIK